MESLTPPTYDPYAAIPFVGYRCDGGHQQETYPSLMHFIESEKFRGVDDGYRKYLLTLTDADDFLLETAGISQAMRRGDWDAIKLQMIHAGLWMQLVQHQTVLADSLLQPDCQTPIDLITQVVRQIYTRLSAAQQNDGDELRRVVLTGDRSITDVAIFDVFDGIFANRLPDEIFVACEDGVAMLAERYCRERYLPVRVFDLQVAAKDLVATEVLVKGTHVFSICAGEQSDSDFAEIVLDLAIAAGKVAHRVQWIA